jgi:anti-anti-sigma regulatory factor
MKDSRKKPRSKAARPRHVRAVSSVPRAVSVTRAATPVVAAPVVAAASLAQPVPVIPSAPVVPAGRTGRVVLGTSCTIQEAGAVRAHLMAQCELPGPYEIDGASVELIDAAGIQLIVAFALDCLEKGVAYKWTGRSATLEKAIELLGVSPLLEYPA